jgi:hypothetical protein
MVLIVELISKFRSLRWMIIDAIVARALYVDANFSYLNIIVLNDFSHPKNLSTALLILLYSSTLYGLGFLPFLGFTGILGSIRRDSKPLLMNSVSYAESA